MSEISLNHADCLREVRDFGVTTVHNICTGTATDVPWGNVEWMLGIGSVIGAIAIIAMLAGMALVTWRM